MRNEFTKNHRLAVLLELSMNYQEELNKAMDQKDTEKALNLIDLKDNVEKLIKDIESRG